MEALEIRDRSIEQALGSADRRKLPAAVALRVGEEPLEGVAHVPGGQPAPVVEAHPRPELEPEALAVVLDGEARSEPRDDPRSLEREGQCLKDLGENLGLFHRGGQ